MSSFLNKGPINLCYHNPMFLLYIKYQWLSCDFCGGYAFGVKVHWTHLRCEGSKGKVLRIDRPDGRRVLKFDGPLGRGLWIALRAMLIKSALRDWMSVSYVTQYPVPPIFSFPLEGKSREAGKGVRGRAPIGCSIAVLTANRRPVSFLLLTLGHTFGMKVQSPMVRLQVKF